MTRVAALMPVPWLDRVFAWRDRFVGDARFRRWAARFPMTRPIARRRARALFDLCAGFVYSQVLYACVRLGLFESLRNGPRAFAELEREFSMPTASARRLLDAAVSLDLVRHESDDRYALGGLGAAMAGNRALAAMVEHHRLLYGDLADPLALLRRERPTALSAYWAYAGTGRAGGLKAGDVAAYTELMTESLPLVADEVLDAYPIGDRKRLLDVGGGEGGFLATAAKRYPDLQLVLFDAPAVASRARGHFEALGLDARATIVGGDFLRDPLPVGADAASLVRVLHDHDDRAALVLLHAIRRALVPGGLLLVAEPMSGAAGAEPVADAYFAFYLLAMGQGRPRSAAQVMALLAQAGFQGARSIPTAVPLQAGVVVARAPAA